MQIYVPIRRTATCKRCGLKYAKKAHQCTYCAELNENKLLELKAQHKKQIQQSKKIFFTFLLLSLLFCILVFLIIYR